MRRKNRTFLLLTLLMLVVLTGCTSQKPSFVTGEEQLTLILPSKKLPVSDSLKLDGLFFETAEGRTMLPSQLDVKIKRMSKAPFQGTTELEDGRKVTVSLKPKGDNFIIKFNATPNEDIVKWGFAIDAQRDEYFTGLMERVVDGHQRASWAPGITEAMDLRGQKVEMIIKPTTSVYAPFYLSSRGYGIIAKTNWPGMYDFCVLIGLIWKIRIFHF